MIDNDTKKLLITLADKYENKEFITHDPISFPHRYKTKQDIEIAGFISSWLAYGKRELFLKVLDCIGKDMKDNPYSYIMNEDYIKFKDNNECLYRFYKKNDFYLLCQRLRSIYSKYPSMEMILQKNKFIESFTEFFGDINGLPNNTKSACKRLCMFMRWMIRKNSPVDFGLWNVVNTKDLIIPLDTHVFRISKMFNLTNRNDATMKTAIEITDNLKQVFNNDPLKGDFALFGYGVNNPQK